MENNKKGISLIVLVITIIVIIILSGTIIFSLKDNDIISLAKMATKTWNEKTLEEEIQVAMNTATIDYILNENASVYTSLRRIEGGEIEENPNGVSDAYYITKNGEYYTVYEDGTVLPGKIVYDGTSIEKPVVDEDGNIHVYNGENLKYIEQVSNGSMNSDIVLSSSTTVYLENDIDLGARYEDGKLVSGVEWVPIGKKNYFLPAFDGKNHVIRGMYVQNTDKFNGLLGNAYNVKNVTIKDGYVEGANCTAAVVGALRGGVIENCKNENTNVVLISGTWKSVGGIVGQLMGEVKTCTNSGVVTAYGYDASAISNAGGIVGLFLDNATISDCINYGRVYANGIDAGGIVGYACNNTRISNCANYGKIEGYGYLGGIAGYLYSNTLLEYSYNCGDVLGGAVFVGGIAGGMYSQTVNVNHCYTKGEIKSPGGCGSIIGSQDNAVRPQDMSKLYYYSKLTLGAINGIDYESYQIKKVDEDITSYDNFITWIKNK